MHMYVVNLLELTKHEILKEYICNDKCILCLGMRAI